MTALAKQTCTPCRRDAPLLGGAELKRLLSELPQWQVMTVDGVQRLVRTYPCTTFATAMSFANAVAALAEQHNHHPSITIEWGKATVHWWTHSLVGLHLNDAILAAKTDAVFALQ